MAVAGAFFLYPLAQRLRQRLGVEHSTCVCVGTRVVETVPAEGDTAAAMARIQATPRVAFGEEPHCRIGYSGSVVGLGAGRLIDALHYLSAGAVSFARGLNDTPKIAALLLVGQTAAPSSSIALTGVVIAAGGWISARRVAETMAHRVTDMSPGQGLTANLVTAALVIGARGWDCRFPPPLSPAAACSGSERLPATPAEAPSPPSWRRGSLPCRWPGSPGHSPTSCWVPGWASAGPLRRLATAPGYPAPNRAISRKPRPGREPVTTTAPSQ